VSFQSGVSNKVVTREPLRESQRFRRQNEVTVETVDSIEVSGFNNQITYHTGSPSIDKSGDGNVVQRG
jgi:hypothetical protein